MNLRLMQWLLMDIICIIQYWMNQMGTSTLWFSYYEKSLQKDYGQNQGYNRKIKNLEDKILENQAIINEINDLRTEKQKS